MAKIITITEKPEQGRKQRVCHVCGEPYEGWNFVQCPDCERSGVEIEIHEAWREV